MWKCALLKKQECPYQKSCGFIFSETVLNNGSRQYSMNEKCCTPFKYENDRCIS